MSTNQFKLAGYIWQDWRANIPYMKELWGNDHVYVLTTMLIILIWCFSVNWSKLQEAAKRLYEVNDFVTDCDNLGNLFIFSGQVYLSLILVAVNINTALSTTFPSMWWLQRSALTIQCESGEVLRNKNFNLESRDPEELLVYVKTLKPGNIVRVASHIDPTPKLTDEIREIFTALGSTVVKSLKPRDSWVFTGTYGINEASPFEKLIQNDMRSNAYEDWPEMGEIIGCFPRISETE
ncbi:uncharacterized protein LOC107666968 [Sinocyclocheilus anshuiensis]|uniref:uncharacterized protein LOC107666968 n=1 Tax=Sinocyclocheilus anshuiensis TaxID=1608454 RepID=UPI0007BA42F7|nr:PREDICTED: uncharacterized protein LOC107666968 [Sinocyclocheilus anshuiensis]